MSRESAIDTGTTASTTMIRDISTMIQSLECELLDPLVRRSPQRLNELIAEDFCEIGRSGRYYTKKDALDVLPALEHPEYSVLDFQAREIAPESILVTFRLEEMHAGSDRPAISMRSSIWQKRDGRWQIGFHQGTPLLQ